MLDSPIKVIIHGHFYQPPREDPWLDYIEEQTSAYPYKNWNVRITNECYAPNCFSRVLDKNGMIRDITNNYEYINFNFGPTLLSWLEKEDKEIYDLIIEADIKSREKHNGHGNAIAQVYNHMLMPLQTKRDKITQIIWGLKDFEHRFGRKSEGLWLAETGVDNETIDLLIDFGIKYVILSPIQAKAVRKVGEDTWTEMTDEGINTQQPYKIIRDHGEIAVFYFNREISNGVSFEHLLRSADKFAATLFSKAIRPEDVVIVASDGEVFGHHEPFGDMCLASLIKNYHYNNKIKLYNCGEYLELFPPTHETTIWLGEDGKGSSWSCVHGVGRWYRDCGCQTGGHPDWNQKWRTPFRNSLDIIRKEFDKIYENELEKIVDDPWVLRNDYIEYILAGYDSSKMDFLDRHVKKKLSKDESLQIMGLLESQKYAMYMYTSCAWFFTELTGIETVQNIKYAYRAIKLLGERGEYITQVFESHLEKALSNIPEFKNGKWVLDNWVIPYMQDLYHVVNNFVALNRYCPNFTNSNFKLFNSFEYQDLSLNKINKHEEVYEGSIRIIDKKGHVFKDYLIILIQKNKRQYILYICAKEDKESYKKVKQSILKVETDIGELPRGVFVLTERDLTDEIKHYITNNTYHDEIEQMIECCIKQFRDMKDLLISYKRMNISLPDVYKSLIKFTAETMFFNLARKLNNFPDREILRKLLFIFDLINHFSVEVDIKELKDTLSEILYRNLVEANNDLESNVYKQALILIEFCNKIKLTLDRSRSENLVYKLIKLNIPLLIERIDTEEGKEKKVSYMLQFRNLIILASNFNINTEDEKRVFFEHLEYLDSSSMLDDL